MNERVITLVSCAASLLMLSDANAGLITNGSGSLANVGDAIVATMVIDGEVVDYALTLTAADIIGTIDWNGAGSRSTPSGLSWDDDENSWTLELALSRSVNLVFSQTGLAALANEPQSRWTVDWDSAGPTTIFDPDSQLNDPVTGTGPGTATFSSLSRVFNSDATWRVSGPDSMVYLITWENTTGGGPGTDAFGLNEALSTLGATPPTGAPEPGTTATLVLGLLALGFRRRGERRRTQ